MRNVMQIGLHTSIEWAYLTWEDWVHGARHPFQVLPEVLAVDPSPFAYYGVDVVPESIVYCSEKAKKRGYSNCKFVCAGVSDISGSKGESKWEKQDWHSIDINCDNIEYLFLPIPSLIEMLCLDALDVLALDIDKYEYKVLQNIKDWAIKPRFMSIEVHGSERRNCVLIDCLAKAGYVLINTFDKSPEKAEEFHFLR